MAGLGKRQHIVNFKAVMALETTAPLTLNRPEAQNLVASERLLKNRAYHSHLSKRCASKTNLFFSYFPGAAVKPPSLANGES